MKPSQMLKTISFIIFLIFANGCATNSTMIQTGQPESPGESVKVSLIQKISFTEEENYTRILIEGTDTVSPPFYKLISDPLRIAIDVPNIDLKQIKDPIKINNGTIGEVIATQYDDKGRIEIGLAQMTNYNISKEEKSLIIDIEKVKKVAEAEAKEVKQEEIVKEKEPEATPVVSTVVTEEIPPVVVKREEAPSSQPLVDIRQPETVKKAKEIIDFSFEVKKDFITFNIMADGKLENYNSFKLDSPARLVLDLWEVSTQYPKKSIKIKNPFIKEVRIGHYPGKLRLVFDSIKPQLAPYQINRIDDKLIVSLGNVPQPSEPQILLQEKATDRTKAQISNEGSVEPPKKQPKTPPPSGVSTKSVKACALTEINFKQMDNKSRIMATFTEEPKFETSKISSKEITVDIKNASVPKHLQRGLDTSEFESAVNYIQIQNIKTGKTSDIRLLIKLREEMPFETTKEGKVLFIDIERPKKVETKIEAPPVPEKKEEVVVEAKKEEEKRKEEKPQHELKKEEKAQIPAEEKPIPPPQVTKKVEEEKKVSEERISEKVYTGRRLSLDFKDADIKNILRLIAEVSNLNIIAGDDVTGKITMRLVDVPWDQALDVILQARALGMSRVGNVVRVAPLETLKREIQTELEARRAKERLEDLVTELIPINYATGKEIIPQIKSVLSDRGDIKVDERTNTLIVKDIPRNIASVKNLVKSLDTKTPQILIEARIVEANLSFQRELGVKWGFQLGGGKATAGGGLSGTTLGTATREVVDLPAVARSGAGGSIGTVGIIEFLFSRGTIQQLDLAISAHENKGDVRVISSPKIATLDNKEASVEQGLRIPYPKLTTEGTVTTDFIDANLKLTVTPHVTNDGHIKMNIKAKKDAPDFTKSVLGVPSIDKKEAITEVLVKDNGVIAIAGIYTIEKSGGTEGIPLFSKIPLLGWLFKREVNEDARKDLLIFISPKINKDQI